jgi:iron complex transport system substrate-binding protein
VSVERVASLRPDLVLAIAEGSARGAVMSLQSAGLPVLIVPSGSLDAVLESIRLVAARIGSREAGARLIETLEERRRAARAVAGAAKGPRPRTVLLIWPAPPQAAGGGTFLHDVLTEAGAENLLAGRSGWPVISAEFLATAPIEVLIVPQSPANAAAYARAFESGTLSRGAAARARVIRVDEDALSRPGPRVFGVLEELSRRLHEPDGR